MRGVYDNKEEENPPIALLIKKEYNVPVDSCADFCSFKESYGGVYA